MNILRTALCAVLALAPACCPDARPPRKSARSDSGDPINVLAAALARAIDHGNGAAATGGGEKSATEGAGDAETAGGGGGKRKKAGKSAPADDAPADDHIPKPRITHEMLEKIKDKAAKEITPENADQELERVRKELEDGAEPSTTGAEKDEAGAVEGAGTVPPVDGEKAGADGEKPADAPPAKDGETSGGE